MYTMKRKVLLVIISLTTVTALILIAVFSLHTADPVEKMLSTMTLRQKAAQMVQAERNGITPQEVKRYGVGSVLSGGGSVPGENTPDDWRLMYRAFQKSALGSSSGIPIIYGVDAVHGHNNLYGATIFPHNIGLGAAAAGALARGEMEQETIRNLAREIGRITAKETAATGVDWTFAPCVAVVRDIRWGRTYESFGETPELQQLLTGPLIRGLQGSDSGKEEDNHGRIGAGHIAATAKHYAADGATVWGTGVNSPIDQGDAQITEEELRQTHLEGFRQAIEADVASIMVSFSSWQGKKLHAHRYLITDLLKGELGFKGVVVSDWEAIHSIPADSRYQQIVTAVNAGVDLFMEPFEWQTFIANLIQAVEQGDVKESRIDAAVRRILTLKQRAGLFDQPLPEKAPEPNVIGSSEHLEVAREAARRSMVLLKNEDDLLPLNPEQPLLVAGSKADDIGSQCGGWTITWQGAEGPITEGTTILEGMNAYRENYKNAPPLINPHTAAPAALHKSLEGLSPEELPKAAVVVTGESPYAEGEGDSAELPLPAKDTALIEALEARGIPTVVILVSGRPLIITEQLSSIEALVAAWLPGSTGGSAAAELLFGKFDFFGKLPVSWPRRAKQSPKAPLHPEEALFPRGFGIETR